MSLCVVYVAACPLQYHIQGTYTLGESLPYDTGKSLDTQEYG